MTGFTCSLWTTGEPPFPDVEVIDQRLLPFEERTVRLTTVEEAAEAIRNMTVRGAPLIGVTAGYGMYLALRQAHREGRPLTDNVVEAAYNLLIQTRPTAVNLRHVLDDCRRFLQHYSGEEKLHQALARADHWRMQDIQSCAAIGEAGLEVIRHTARHRPTVHILTHCNAGWLGCIEWGTALAPIYKAHAEGIDVHVWVDETRPRNQGLLTSWELTQRGIPHTVITDNAGGLLMMEGKVDMVIVGADRVSRNGDVANKVGTYLKALAAYHHNVPFYVAFPFSTFDAELDAGSQIPIEYRSADEITHLRGRCDGRTTQVRIMPKGTQVLNPAFDITPARYVTAYLTDRGRYTPATLRNALR